MRMEKYISFLDILGFSDIILDNNLVHRCVSFKF
jgi:hypothetical protein